MQHIHTFQFKNLKQSTRCVTRFLEYFKDTFFFKYVDHVALGLVFTAINIRASLKARNLTCERLSAAQEAFWSLQFSYFGYVASNMKMTCDVEKMWQNIWTYSRLVLRHRNSIFLEGVGKQTENGSLIPGLWPYIPNRDFRIGSTNAAHSMSSLCGT
jgi:hypothetical protein